MHESSVLEACRAHGVSKQEGFRITHYQWVGVGWGCGGGVLACVGSKVIVQYYYKTKLVQWANE